MSEAALHPSPTSSDGREIHKSTYEKPGDPKEKRLECAQCGWRFNPDQRAEGNTGGDGYTAGTRIADTVHNFSNTEANLPYHLRGISTFTASSRTVKDPVDKGGLGCPFCGSTSPRATMRDDEATWGRIDLTNQ